MAILWYVTVWLHLYSLGFSGQQSILADLILILICCIVNISVISISNNRLSFRYSESKTCYYMTLLYEILLYTTALKDGFLKLICEWGAFYFHIIRALKIKLCKSEVLLGGGKISVNCFREYHQEEKLPRTTVTVYNSHLLWKSRRNWRGIVVCSRKTAIRHGICYTSQASFSPCS